MPGIFHSAQAGASRCRGPAGWLGTAAQGREPLAEVFGSLPWCHPGEELVELPKIWKWEGKGEQQCFGTAAVTAWEGKCDEWELLGGADPGLDGNPFGASSIQVPHPPFLKPDPWI